MINPDHLLRGSIVVDPDLPPEIATFTEHNGEMALMIARDGMEFERPLDYLTGVPIRPDRLVQWFRADKCVKELYSGMHDAYVIGLIWIVDTREDYEFAEVRGFLPMIDGQFCLNEIEHIHQLQLLLAAHGIPHRVKAEKLKA